MSDSEEETRSKISNMPLGQVLKLKREIGSTNFNQALGKQKKPPKIITKPQSYSDDEAPIEMSSKHPIPLNKPKRTHIGPRPRDPRFDPRCGEFKSSKFRENYDFVFSLKEEELTTLRQSLRETNDPEEKEKIKFLIQRQKNQIRDHKLQLELKKKRDLEKEEALKAAQEGQKPFYMKKKDKKMTELVDKYLELKSSGRLQKHIEKRRKKTSSKIKKKLNL